MVSGAFYTKSTHKLHHKAVCFERQTFIQIKICMVAFGNKEDRKRAKLVNSVLLSLVIRSYIYSLRSCVRTPCVGLSGPNITLTWHQIEVEWHEMITQNNTFSKTDPEVIKPFSCSTQLSMKFVLL